MPPNKDSDSVQGQEPIAIIGYSYRLPGVAEDKDELVWDLYANRKAVRVDIVEESKRYDKGQIPWDGEPNPFKHASQWEGAFINFKEAAFDPQFFHTNINDASSMDIHHKLGMLTAAEALENAGIDFSTLTGTDTGVFAGGQVSGAANFRPSFGYDEYTATGTAQTMMANRISFFFNLTGPSVTYDTACSGMMTALHGAQASLQARECKLGILVAAVVHYGHAHNPSFAQLGVLSTDGRCRSFDDSATGYMPADGVFCYILKRLSDAERDNNKIYGVIRGVHVSAVGPGEDHLGMTACRSLTTPTVEGQKLAIEGAYSRSGMSFDSVNYIECHATGTKAGDYMEASALGKVFGTPSRKTPLMISSSRSNFGHMEGSSAGVSILKTLLMFKHRTYLPLSDSFSTPNAIIPFEKLKLQPLTTCVPFPESKVAIGINSFGFGGANGHAIIEEYVPSQPPLYSHPRTINQAKYHTFVLSAKSSKGLYTIAKSLIEVIEALRKDPRDEQEILYHLAGNLAVRRTAYDVRKSFTANSLAQLTGLLDDFITPKNGETRKEVGSVSEHHDICFVFSGQGSQWEGCGVSLYHTEPVFRSAVDKIDAYFFELSGRSLKELMLSHGEEKPKEEKTKEKGEEGEKGNEKEAPVSELDRCDVAQPFTFMIQVGLVELCRSAGIHPACMIGHSAGELAAAYASGAIPLKEMVRVVYERARLQQQISGAGRMLVIPLSPQELQQELEINPRKFREIEISCYNTPNVTVVSGPDSVCQELSTHLKLLRGIKCQLIRGSIPFHSSKMDSIKEDIFQALSFLDEINSLPQIPVVSTVKAIVEGSFDKHYWWLNTRKAVKFEQAVAYVFKHFRPTVFMELSPHITLRSNVRDIYTHLGATPAAYVPTLIRNENGSKMWANAIGAVFEKGYNLDWNTLYPNPVHIKLPNYPFDYKMVANPMLDENVARRHGPFGAGPLIGRALWTEEQTYEVVVSAQHFPFLKGHVVGTVAIMPAAGYIEMVLQAFNGVPVTLKYVRFSAACPVMGPKLLQLKITSPEDPLDPVEFKISSTTSRFDATVPWTIHCSGVVQRIPQPEDKIKDDYQEKEAKDKRKQASDKSTESKPKSKAAKDTKGEEKEKEVKEEVTKREIPGFTPEQITKLYDHKQFYDRIPDETLNYTEGFKIVKEFFQDKNDPRHCWARIKLDDKHFEGTQKAGWFLHPYMLDGIFQSFVGLSTGRRAIPYGIEEFKYLHPPTASSVIVEIIHPQIWSSNPLPGIINNGDAKIYNEDGTLICTVKTSVGLVPTAAEGTNSIQAWQKKFITVPDAPVLATEISETPKDMASVELTRDLLDEFRKAVVTFLELEEASDNDTVVKKMALQPTPIREYIQLLWDKSQKTLEPNKTASPQFLEFAENLASELPKYTVEKPITPQWAYAPFVPVLKQLVDLVVGNDSRRVVRILEVCNSCNFSVLPQLQHITTTSLEYIVASSSSDILSGITDKAQFDFPIRSMQADFEKSISSDVVPFDGFFDLIIVNLHTGLDTQEKFNTFLTSCREKVTPGGLLALTGFEQVPEWLRCVGIDSKMVMPLSFINNCDKSHFSMHRVVPTKLHPSFPHTIHILKPLFEIKKPLPEKPAQNGNPTENGHPTPIENGNSLQNGKPTENGNAPKPDSTIHNVVFADSCGFYEIISDVLPSPVCVPRTADLSFDINEWLTSGKSLNIVFLWCLQDKTEFCVETFNPLIELARKIAQAENLGKINVWVVTQNAVLESSNTHGGTTWGLVRTIGQELTDIQKVRFHIVDIGAKEDMPMFLNLMSSNFCENECMIRNSEIFVSRLLPLIPEAKEASAHDKIIHLSPATENTIPFRLKPARNAQLNSMSFHSYSLPEVLEEDMITVRVHYTALNFRDLMVAQDRLPHMSYEKSHLGKNLGIECSGIVIAVAPNVDWLVPGDKVVCTTGACIANIITVDHRKCLKVPESIPMPQASSLLSVYLTAYYALIYMARLTRGNSVLVHSGMGGIGQATIALAHHYGLEVYATAGTEEKRTKLRKLGCTGVYDSHSYEWAAQLLKDTEGNGVDAVLNSLSGHHIELGLQVLTYRGWFCEIGKRDIYNNSKIGLFAMRKNITFTAVDSDSLLATHPKIARDLCELLLKMIEEGQLPTIPIEIYPLSDYLKAFRLIQQAKHNGKVVLSLLDSKPVAVIDHRRVFSPKGTYLVTGGFGGVGSQLLHYMYANGACNFLLTDANVSRGRTVEYVKQASQLGDDANIVIEPADVSKYEDVERVVKGCASKLPPLVGVFHLAGISDGGTILNQNTALYEKVLAAKAHGALNLHKATQQHAPPLTHFVMLSSVASALGSSGQANYAAANAFLDALVRHRRASGLCGTSYNMGAVSDVGMASTDPQIRRALRVKGINLVTSDFALAGLDYQLRNNIPEMISACFCLEIKFTYPWGYSTAGLLSTSNMSESVVMSHGVVLGMVCKQVQKLTGASEVPPNQPLSSFGIDSMMGTELSIWIKDKFNVQVSAMRLLSTETCETLTQKIISNHNNKSSSSAASGPVAYSTPSREGNVLLGVDTEFVESKKIGNEFPDEFTKTPLTFSEELFASVGTGKIEEIKKSVAQSHADHPFRHLIDTETKKATALLSTSKAPNVSDTKYTPSTSLDGITKDSKEQVQQDIEDIYNSFAEFMKTIEPPKPVHEFQNVFLTGATGFAGRVFLAHMLKHQPHLKITCIVRAENHSVALARVKEALENAGYWEDSYASNIIAIPGDLAQDRLGQSEEDYDKLCKTQHAVFHFAANISLVEPYSSIREDNTLVMLQLLRFCATSAAKPLHHMSTLAVYPEYTTGFPPAWANKVLMEDEEPNLERFVSPKEMGYPWSKWGCEQVALRCCKLANIPMVIYRIPFLLSATSDSGFMSDVSMLVSIAALQEGIMPALSFPVNFTALDVVCEVIFQLATNNHRKHHIYNIISKEAHHWSTLWRWMNEVGFNVKYIADEQVFLETGTKPGSPLKKILPMLELMRAQWYFAKRPLDDPVIKNGLPISTKNVEEDYKKVKWPSAELGYVSAFIWMLRKGDKWEYPLPKLELKLEGVMQHVQSFTGLSSMGPNSYYEPLARLIDSLNAEAKLSDIGRTIVRQDICRRLMNRQYLFKAIRASPEILQTKIVRPVFLVGIPGSGAVYLHRALAEDPRFRTPYVFETHYLARNPNESEEVGKNENPEDKSDFSHSPDARLRKTYTDWQSRKTYAEDMGFQVEEVTTPVTDYTIMQHDIQCLSWSTLSETPSFRSWLLSQAKMGGSYAFHKQFLQFLQFYGRSIIYPGNDEYSWVLECPMHMLFLQHIFEMYPDALVVQCHRPPAEAISWTCGTVVEKLRKVYSDEVDNKEMAQGQMKDAQEMLKAIQNFRASHPELEQNFVDVQYHDLVHSPVKTLDNLYKHLIPDHTLSAMKQYVRARPTLSAKLQNFQKRMEQDAQIPFDLETFGLSKAQIEENFKNIQT